MFNAKRSLCAVILSSTVVGCGPAADNSSSTDNGAATTNNGNAGTNSAGTTGMSLVVPSGLYDGTADQGEDSALASLGIWGSEEGETYGRLLLDGVAQQTQAYSVAIEGDRATFTPVPEACVGCLDDVWAGTITMDGRTLRVVPDLAADVAGGGGIGLILQPHDGFKPELNPIDATVYAGAFAAVDPRFSPPAISANCQVAITDTGLESFSCASDIGDWTREVTDSLVQTDTTLSFVLASDEGSVALVGELDSSGEDPHLKGVVVPIENGEIPQGDAIDWSTVVGTFDFTLL